MFQGLKNHLNTEIAFGIKWWHAHVIIGIVLVAIILTLLSVSGYFAYKKYGESYFRYHCTVTKDGHCTKHTGYKAPLPVPVAASGPIYFPKVSLPPTGSVNTTYLPGVGDQDGLGACQCWASNYTQLTYIWRQANPTHWWKFSPRYCYDYISHGHDNGSYFDEDINLPGFVRWKYYPYPPDIIAPAPPSDLPLTHFRVQNNTIDSGQGGGQGVVDAVRYELATIRNPINFDLPVWPEFDNATNNNGFVTSPTATEYNDARFGRGGHAITIIGYNDTLSYNGETGFVRVVNQWSKYWGVKGYGWVSYAFLEKYGWDIKYLTYAGTGTARPKAGPYSGSVDGAGKGKKYYLPSSYTHNKADDHISVSALPTATSWYVHNVFTKQGQDISGLINHYGDYYHIFPIGIAATVGTESGFDQYASRYGTWPDVSFGLMQETVQTANGYGILGDVRSWEYVPENAVSLGIHILHDYSVYRGWDFPGLYCLYNAGENTSGLNGPCAGNYYNNFLPNYYFAVSHFQCYSNCPNGSNPNPIPKPLPQPTFKKKLWDYYQWEHHQPLISAYYHGRLSWAASVWILNQNGCRAIVSTRWIPKRHGYTYTQFQGCGIYTWPDFKSYKVVKTGYWK